MALTIQEQAKEALVHYKNHYALEGRELVLAVLAKLQEEQGELAEEILMHLSLQRDAKLQRHDPTNLAKEFGDVLFVLTLLAEATGVDSEQVLRAVEEKHGAQWARVYRTEETR